MKMSQLEVEAMFSPEETHETLKRGIIYQFDKRLVTWALRGYLRIGEYLKGSYYASKDKRIHELCVQLKTRHMDDLLATILAAVIRNRKDTTLQKIVGYIAASLPHEDPFANVTTAGELVALVGGPGKLIEITRSEIDDTPMVKCNNWTAMTGLFHQELDWIDDTHYHPPLIEPPHQVKDRHSCGYWSVDVPVLLGNYTQHDNALDFKTLNILNSIPWLLDKDVLAEGEQPPKPLVTMEEQINFWNHERESRRIYDMLGEDPFYLVWQYDSRGRIYSHGHHVNFQSYAFKKALLAVDHFEVLT
jgi:hypothetical protein